MICDRLVPPNGKEFLPGQLQEMNVCICCGCGQAYSNDDVMINTHGPVCLNCLHNTSELVLGQQRFYNENIGKK